MKRSIPLIAKGHKRSNTGSAAVVVGSAVVGSAVVVVSGAVVISAVVVSAVVVSAVMVSKAVLASVSDTASVPMALVVSIVVVVSSSGLVTGNTEMIVVAVTSELIVLVSETKTKSVSELLTSPSLLIAVVEVGVSVTEPLVRSSKVEVSSGGKTGSVEVLSIGAMSVREEKTSVLVGRMGSVGTVGALSSVPIVTKESMEDRVGPTGKLMLAVELLEKRTEVVGNEFVWGRSSVEGASMEVGSVKAVSSKVVTGVPEVFVMPWTSPVTRVRVDRASEVDASSRHSSTVVKTC
jgi:hypothetical protein